MNVWARLGIFPLFCYLCVITIINGTMKRFFFAIAVLAVAVSCSPKLYNTRSFDDAHFAALQEVIDNPSTPKDVAYSYTEAADLGLLGKVSNLTANPYHRFDTTAYKGMTKGERNQAVSPAGISVAFSTNSNSISIKAEWGDYVASPARNTMALSYRGFDLYIKDRNGKWLWAGTTGTASGKPEFEGVLVKNLPEGVKECLLYLPIYTEVKSCKIGVTVGSYIKKLDGQFRHRILFHGSSFTQGISTSRAGMSYPMQFMRANGFEVLGFGMSGNCKMQPYFADVVADTEADAYVFDAFSNPGYKTIRERLQPFIDRIIAAHPGKPLIFQQTIYREKRNFDAVENAKEQAKQDMASTLFNDLLKDPKYKDVYFIQTSADDSDRHEYSVDGTHPDDHGYYMWYKSIEKPILKILAKYGIK